MKQVLLIFFFLLFSSCSFREPGWQPVTDTSSDDWDGNYYIKYEVVGTTYDVDIVFEDSDGNYYEEDGDSTPWSTEFQVYCGTDPSPDLDLTVYLSAQNLDDSGIVQVNIYYKKNPSDSYSLYQSSSDSDTATVSGSLL